mmetsp:Transcript_41957/g.48284  ORF Transcript_41957/g.48284 Transcript_41957/m.48284 type:complete len:528 (+) Transcript_41957:34-1617(+)
MSSSLFDSHRYLTTESPSHNRSLSTTCISSENARRGLDNHTLTVIERTTRREVRELSKANRLCRLLADDEVSKGRISTGLNLSSPFFKKLQQELDELRAFKRLHSTCPLVSNDQSRISRAIRRSSALLEVEPPDLNKENTPTLTTACTVEDFAKNQHLLNDRAEDYEGQIEELEAEIKRLHQTMDAMKREFHKRLSDKRMISHYPDGAMSDRQDCRKSHDFDTIQDTRIETSAVEPSSPDTLFTKRVTWQDSPSSWVFSTPCDNHNDISCVTLCNQCTDKSEKLQALDEELTQLQKSTSNLKHLTSQQTSHIQHLLNENTTLLQQLDTLTPHTHQKQHHLPQTHTTDHCQTIEYYKDLLSVLQTKLNKKRTKLAEYKATTTSGGGDGGGDVRGVGKLQRLFTFSEQLCGGERERELMREEDVRSALCEVQWRWQECGHFERFWDWKVGQYESRIEALRVKNGELRRELEIKSRLLQGHMKLGSDVYQLELKVKQGQQKLKLKDEQLNRYSQEIRKYRQYVQDKKQSV